MHVGVSYGGDGVMCEVCSCGDGEGMVCMLIVGAFFV